MTEETQEQFLTRMNDERDPEAAEERLAARMEAEFGPLEDAPPVRPAPGPGSRLGGRLSRVALGERSWFLAYEQNERVDAAYRSIESLVVQINDTVDEYDALPGQQSAQEHAYVQAVAKATAAGEPAPKAPKPVDVIGRHRELTGRYQGLQELLLQARREHDAAVAAALPGLAERLLTRIPETRERAEAALDVIAAAVATHQQWQDAIYAARRAMHESGKRVPQVKPRPGSPKPHALRAALQEARAAMASDDPAITGAYLQDDGIVPTRIEREQYFNSGGGALLELARIEAAEDYRHTQFTKDFYSRQMSRGLSTQDYQELVDRAQGRGRGGARQRSLAEHVAAVEAANAKYRRD